MYPFGSFDRSAANLSNNLKIILNYCKIAIHNTVHINQPKIYYDSIVVYF